MLTEEDKQKLTRFAAAKYCAHRTYLSHRVITLRQTQRAFIDLDKGELDEYFLKTIQRFRLLGDNPVYTLHTGSKKDILQQSQYDGIRTFHDAHAEWFHAYGSMNPEPYLTKEFSGMIFTFDMNINQFI